MTTNDNDHWRPMTILLKCDVKSTNAVPSSFLFDILIDTAINYIKPNLLLPASLMEAWATWHICNIHKSCTTITMFLNLLQAAKSVHQVWCSNLSSNVSCCNNYKHMQQTAAPCILIMYLKHSIIQQNAQHLHHQLRLSATTPVKATYASSSMVIILLNSLLSCSNNSSNSYASNSKISINCNNCAATTAPAMAAYTTSNGSTISTTVSKISDKSCSNIRISISIIINCNYCAASTAPAISLHTIIMGSTVSTTHSKISVKSCSSFSISNSMNYNYCAASTAPVMASYAIINNSIISTTISKYQELQRHQHQHQHEVSLLCRYYSWWNMYIYVHKQPLLHHHNYFSKSSMNQQKQQQQVQQ